MGKEVGRNDPCPCGSGKKYKKCCGLNSTRRKFSAKVIGSDGNIHPWMRDLVPAGSPPPPRQFKVLSPQKPPGFQMTGSDYTAPAEPVVQPLSETLSAPTPESGIVAHPTDDSSSFKKTENDYRQKKTS